MTDFRIERVIDNEVIDNESDSDTFIAKSTCKHCGQSFECDLRKARLETLLNRHLEACPKLSPSRPQARVLEFRRRSG